MNLNANNLGSTYFYPVNFKHRICTLKHFILQIVYILFCVYSRTVSCYLYFIIFKYLIGIIEIDLGIIDVTRHSE